jgi:hypothetical protein
VKLTNAKFRRLFTMKALINAALIVGVLATPVASFAQDATGPLTRAEVRADLIRVEQAGYRLAAKDVQHPAHIQAAEALGPTSALSGSRSSKFSLAASFATPPLFTQILGVASTG